MTVAPPKKPVVSVITISKDDLQGLRRTRQSVAEQSYELIEHVIVDADSSDGTAHWLGLQSADVRWLSEPDRGRYDGMNKGVRLAEGDLLWFMNAGDAFAKRDAVEIVVDDWGDLHWAWAYGAARLVAPDGQIVGVNAPIPFKLRRFALGESVLPHQAACFRASLLRQIGGYDLTFGVAADQLLMLKAALVSTPRAIPEFLCDFDLGGIGSERSPFRHYYDAGRARRMTGLGLPGGRIVDMAAVVGLAASETVKRAAVTRLRLDR